MFPEFTQKKVKVLPGPWDPTWSGPVWSYLQLSSSGSVPATLASMLLYRFIEQGPALWPLNWSLLCLEYCSFRLAHTEPLSSFRSLGKCFLLSVAALALQLSDGFWPSHPLCLSTSIVLHCSNYFHNIYQLLTSWMINTYLLCLESVTSFPLECKLSKGRVCCLFYSLMYPQNLVLLGLW